MSPLATAMFGEKPHFTVREVGWPPPGTRANKFVVLLPRPGGRPKVVRFDVPHGLIEVVVDWRLLGAVDE